MIKKVVFRKSIIVEPEWMDNYFFENKLYEKAIQNKKRYTTIKIPEKNVIGLTIPIRNKGINLGLVTLIGNQFDEPYLDHISLVTSFADAIGLVVENARQRKRSDELLILEERQRLAHDLHDSVSQSLYGLVISADVSNKLLRLKEYNGLKETLKDIEETALQSLREMRLMLFELRPLFFETVGLARALEMRLNIVERRSGIDTVMNLCGTEKIPSPLDIEIYGIATEAMNNSLKHSRADLIKIDLEVKDNEVMLEISDDGVGFDMSERDIGGIGFSSMRERSNRINSQLEIISKVNQGTRIILKVPLISNESTVLKLTKNLISVLVVDDHPIVRRGLIAEINMNQDMRVIGEAKNGLEAIDMAERLNPNVILMDIVMPEMDGISATKTILASHPAIKILILTSFTDEEQIFPAITSGAHGFIYKDEHPDKVLDAI